MSRGGDPLHLPTSRRQRRMCMPGFPPPDSWRHQLAAKITAIIDIHPMRHMLVQRPCHQRSGLRAACRLQAARRCGGSAQAAARTSGRPPGPEQESLGPVNQPATLAHTDVLFESSLCRRGKGASARRCARCPPAQPRPPAAANPKRHAARGCCAGADDHAGATLRRCWPKLSATARQFHPAERGTAGRYHTTCEGAEQPSTAICTQFLLPCAL